MQERAGKAVQELNQRTNDLYPYNKTDSHSMHDGKTDIRKIKPSAKMQCSH